MFKLFSSSKKEDESTTFGVFQPIPQEVIKIFISFLGVKELCRITQVNSTFKNLANDEKIWQKVGLRYYSHKDFFPDCPSKNDVRLQWIADHAVFPRFSNTPAHFLSKTKVGRLLFKETLVKLLLVGLDAAGKTTLVYSFTQEVETLIPTIGFNVEVVKKEDAQFTCWDVGGPDKIRPLWRHYLQGMQAMIFMIDSNDTDRIEEARDELHKLLREDELRDIVLLVFANKQDLPNAMSAETIVEALELKNLKISWHIQKSIAISGIGIYEGLDWLANSVKQKNK